MADDNGNDNDGRFPYEDIPNEQGAQLNPGTKAQHQSNLAGLSMSDEEQTKAQKRVEQVTAKGMEFVKEVHGKTEENEKPSQKDVGRQTEQKATPQAAQTEQPQTIHAAGTQSAQRSNNLRELSLPQTRSGERMNDLRQVLQNQLPPPDKGGPNTTPPPSSTRTTEKEAGLSVFDQYSQKEQKLESLRQVSQNHNRANTQSQAQNLEKTKQQEKAVAKNVFDKHNQQRDKSKEQEQQKEQSRGR